MYDDWADKSGYETGGTSPGYVWYIVGGLLALGFLAATYYYG